MSNDHTADVAYGTIEWAAGLAVDNLTPSTEHAITMQADDRPIFRIHFAFEPGMPEEMRTALVQGIGESVQAAATPPAVIPSEVAAHVLFSEGHGGYPAGSFTTKLLSTWGYADDANAARLAAGWPDYAAALNLLQQPDGIARLTAIANGTQV
ncbi:hypothetical protein [Streptomyces sp. RK76]|uniref:hypothetical protein n=1 Tax=Streptomyces sp. RK76 TaxID=2824896 RepID=UPI001B376ADF|nr:hypothetical protein [Streptomyces sp. RK76]MBQ0947682.1 hypothetical protein [Streptomyces sp. RK76]